MSQDVGAMDGSWVLDGMWAGPASSIVTLWVGDGSSGMRCTLYYPVCKCELYSILARIVSLGMAGER